MTAIELYIGVRKILTTRGKRRKLEAVLNPYLLVDMGSSVSRRGGRLLGERMADANEDERLGTGTSGAAIAATAPERDGYTCWGQVVQGYSWSHPRSIPVSCIMRRIVE
jgi:hypothetical protein